MSDENSGMEDHEEIERDEPAVDEIEVDSSEYDVVDPSIERDKSENEDETVEGDDDESTGDDNADDSESVEGDSDEENADDEDESSASDVDEDLISQAIELGLPANLARTLDKAGTLATTLAGHILNKPTGETEDVEEKEKDDWKPLDPDEFDQEIVDRDKAMHDKLVEQQKQIESILGKSQVDSQSAENDRFDNMFNGLGDDYDEMIGKDTYKTIDQDSDQFRNRSEIFEEAKVFAQIYPNKTEKELFAKAVNSVLGEHSAKLERKKISKSLTKRSKSIIQKPVSRDGKKLTNMDKTLDEVEKIMNNPDY